MTDIFVSYASEDRARIEPLVILLEAAGHSVWWDRDLEGGTVFSERIERELTQASVAVVAWSANAVRSRWVADEADLALETGKLLPISLDGTRSPMGFRQLQTIDFSSWSGGDDPCVSALLDALVHHLRAASRAPNQALTMPISAQTKTDASIAVLPFLNMSADPDQEYFADGISEELLNLLAKIKELAVIARTSCFNFKGTNKSISEIGTILGVSFVLEGSIRKAGNRVRITAQLVETKSSHHLWSETYDRDLDDIFAIQDEISLAIVGELKDQILGGSDIKAPQTERTSNLDAYEQYLQGQQLLNSRIRDNTIRSKELFEEALARDPDYAPALIGLADAHLLLSDHWTCMGVTPIKEALADAKPMLDRALEINPNAAEALGVKALYFLLEGNIEAAIGHTKKALTVNPNYSRGHRLNGIILWQLGDPEAPISSALESAIECDPASLLDYFNFIMLRLQYLDYDRAKIIKQRMAAIAPTSQWEIRIRAVTSMYKGEYKAALEGLLSADIAFSHGNYTKSSQRAAIWLGYGEPFDAFNPVLALEHYAANGLLDDARRVGAVVEAFEGAREDYETAQALAIWQAVEGNHEEALALLTPFDEPDLDKWGRHFRFDIDLIGAPLCFYVRHKLGKKASARFYLEKLKDLHEALEADPTGRRLQTDYVGAVIAVAQDDKPAALDALERQVERTMYNAMAFVKAPNFEALIDEPRYQALLTKVEMHNAREREAAEVSGLLPLPEKLILEMKEK